MNESHYNEAYFQWQHKAGEFGGKADLFKFKGHVKPDSDILEFGCGGGYLLKNISTSGKKIGIEINPSAREIAEENGIVCFSDIKKIENNSIDIIISNHALEHVENPIIIIAEFKRVLRKNGKIVLAVPHEVSGKVKKKDINMHLYTWSPQNLYNLMTVCGIEMVSCKRLCHAWMPYYITIQRITGWNVFHKSCRLYARITKKYQTVAIGIIK